MKTAATPSAISPPHTSRREFLATAGAVGATMLLPGCMSRAPAGKTTFTILHTNDLHSNLIGMGPASDYTPFTLNDDRTRGGFARLATVIAQRKAARNGQGSVLILDAGDHSMGTAFGSAIGHTGAELQLLSRMGYDATTFGNHDFDSVTISFAVSMASGYVIARSLYVGMVLAAIPKITKGLLPLVPKNQKGQALTSKAEALDMPRVSTPDLLPPAGAVDSSSVVTKAKGGALQEIKEWEALMDHLRSLPVKGPGELPALVIDERAKEIRAVKVG
jgi:TAT (twin-arginine translocation) pathway signal sequence/Calcineurin-like phosphoesterase